MLNQSIFKAYDIRGIYPKDLDVATAEQIGKAAVLILKEGEILLAHDIRHGKEELIKALETGILAEAQKTGRKFVIRYIGLSTTPMFYFLVNNFKAAGGCMVTASHNPKEYNGVKMVGPGAEMISGKKVLEVIQTLEA